MLSRRVHASQDTVSVDAPAGVVYGMLADAVRWPLLLPSYVHVERMDFDGVREQLRLWDLEAGRVRSLHVRRTLHPHTRTIEFEQEDASWPGAPTEGSWTVSPAGEQQCLLTLRRTRTLSGPAAAGSTRADDVFEAAARTQLAHVKEIAEHWEKLDELLLSFEDSVRVEGPFELVYDFLYRIGDWVELIPHVEWTSVTEDEPGIQLAAMDTCAARSGRTDTIEAVRLCFPSAGRIVYKETMTPELIAAHSGEWYLVPDASGVTVVSAHHLMLEEAAVAPVLGPDATLAEARRYVREWLGRESTEALALAKWHAQSAVRRLR
jgi:aromatase